MDSGSSCIPMKATHAKPVHVHITKGGVDAKFWLSPVRLASIAGLLAGHGDLTHHHPQAAQGLFTLFLHQRRALRSPGAYTP
jgi:hypothetical protein